MKKVLRVGKDVKARRSRAALTHKHILKISSAGAFFRHPDCAYVND